MATYTENYNLEKPAQSDLYNIDVFNENADKIDEALGSKASNQSLAPIESTSTATRNYSIGQQFVYNGLLYEATSAIASGGTITPGSNCARTTVAEELSALNDSLANHGVYYGGTFDTTSISGNSAQNKVAEMSLPAGVYVINASCQWASNFTEVTGMYFDGIGANSVVRNTGAGGGGLNIIAVVKLLATTTVSVYVYQASSSSKSINQTRFAAVKLS